MIDYNELYNIINNILKDVKGIGELYIYDTSLRIGAKLNHFPNKVYLHAGTRKGAKYLGLQYKSESVEIRDLPQEFKQLEPREVEDILCIYEDYFKKLANHCVHLTARALR